MQTSVFSEHLAELLKYSLRIDGGTIDGADFVALQRMEVRIVNAGNAGYYTHSEKKALYAICAGLIDNTRDALKRSGELH